MSESPYNPVAAALGNALADATGIRFTAVRSSRIGYGRCCMRSSAELILACRSASISKSPHPNPPRSAGLSRENHT